MNQRDDRDIIARSNFDTPHAVHPGELAAIPEDVRRRGEQLRRAYGGVAYRQSLPTAGGSADNGRPPSTATMIDFNPDRVPVRVYRGKPLPPSKVRGESKAARRMRRRNLR